MPAEEKVYAGEVAVLLAPEARAVIDENVRSVLAPPPLAVADIWKKFEKLVTVEPVPLFVMVAEKFVESPTIAVVGVAEPAVRSGAAREVTVTFAHAPQLFSSLTTDPSLMTPPPALDVLSAQTRTE